jgi:hypothetical protein
MSKLRRDLKDAPIERKVMRAAEIIAACAPANTAIGNVTAELADFTTKNTKLEGDFGISNTAQSEATRLVGVTAESNGDWDLSFEGLLVKVESNTHGDKDPMRTITVDTYEPGRGTPRGTPDQVANVAVTDGDTEHEQEITWNGLRPKPLMGYKVRMCEAPYEESKMVEVGEASGSRFVKGGQTGGKTYCWQVCAVGSGGVRGRWSDPAEGMAR